MRPRLVKGGGRPKDPRLTADEKVVLDLLAEAWNAYVKLPQQHPADRGEFATFLHGCQGIIAIRVARVADPEVWAIEESAG